jgi:hypothetical protein
MEFPDYETLSIPRDDRPIRMNAVPDGASQRSRFFVKPAEPAQSRPWSVSAYAVSDVIICKFYWLNFVNTAFAF